VSAAALVRGVRESSGLDLEVPVVVGDAVVAMVDGETRLFRVERGMIAWSRPCPGRAEALAGAGLADAGRWAEAIETLRAGYEA
jgi:hypothetical protein